MPPLKFFSGFRIFWCRSISPKVGWLGRVSQLMTLFVEVGVEAKLGLQDPHFLRRSKETNLGLRYGYMIYTTLSIFLCFFFAGISKKYPKSSTNKKQLKKKHKKVLSHQPRFVCLFFLFKVTLLRMYYHIKITIFHHHWLNHLPPLETFFPSQTGVTPFRRCVSALFSLMKSFGSKGEVAFNHFTWRSWGSDGEIRSVDGWQPGIRDSNSPSWGKW